jgi:hypothetical protein
MADIQVAGATLPNYHYTGSTHELRIRVSEGFTASDGTVVANGDGFWQSVSLTSAGAFSAHTLKSVSDAPNTDRPRYTYKIYVDGEFVQSVNIDGVTEFYVPASPASTTLGELATATRAHNNVRGPRGQDGYYNAGQVDSRLAQRAPGGARYVVQSSDPDLTNEQNLGALTTGLLKNTVAGGVGTLSRAVPDTDYVAPTSSLISTAPGSALTGYRLIASNYNFTTLCSTAVSTAGVRDPVDKELTFTLGTGGSLSNGGQYIMFTYTNASGETVASNARAAGTYNSCTLVIPSPPAVTGATGWNFYATNIASAYTTARKQNGSPIAIGTPFTYDTYNAAGSTLPASNTTGGSATVTVADGSLLFAPVDSASNYTATVRQAVLVDEGTSQEEYVYVMAKPSSTTFTAVFSKTHSAGFAVKSATGGIQEAIMSLPPFPTTPFTTGGKGGTVIIPLYTVIKAPIQLRRGTRLESDAVPGPLSDLGGFRFGGVIRFNSTDVGLGAVMTFGLSNEYELHNVAVWSNTNAFYSQGASGTTGNSVIDGCLLYGNFGQTVHASAGFRASAGTFYLRITNSVIVGSPAVWIYGQFLNSTTIEHCLVVPQRDGADPTYIAEGIVITANGGSPHGFAGGGFIRIRDVTTENGNGPLLNFTDVNFDVEQFDVADWVPNVAIPQPQIKVTQTDGYAISTMRLSRVVLTYVNDPAWTAQAGVVLRKVITFSPFNTISTVTIEDSQFPSYNPAIDAGGIRGPLRLLKNHNLDVTAASGNGAVVNAPSEGLLAFGNFAPLVNTPDGIFTDTGTNGIRLTHATGISGTTTPAKNLRGSVTLSGGTANVTFGTAEPDASYFPFLSSSANEIFRWSALGTGGFTITSSNGASTATVYWLIVR